MRFRLTAAFSAGLMLCMPTPIPLAETAATEPNLRAAIVYRLLQASSWPRLEQKKVKVCEFGNGKNAAALQLLDTLTLGAKRELSVASSEPGNSKCDVIILGPEKESVLDDAVKDRFLICNACKKNRHLSTIDLFLYQDQIRYDINLAVAGEAGIHFSSDALRYARTIRKK